MFVKSPSEPSPGEVIFINLAVRLSEHLTLIIINDCIHGTVYLFLVRSLAKCRWTRQSTSSCTYGI